MVLTNTSEILIWRDCRTCNPLASTVMVNDFTENEGIKFKNIKHGD